MSEHYPALDQNALAVAVRRCGWAYLLIHCHINLGTLDILPDWAGYWMILSALPMLAAWVPSAKLLRPLGRLMAIYELALWLIKLLGYTSAGPLTALGLTVMLRLLFLAVLLYFHFQLLTDLAEAARQTSYSGRESLLRFRTVYVILTTLLSLPQILFVIPMWIRILLTLCDLGAAFLLCFKLLAFGKWLCQPEETI